MTDIPFHATRMGQRFFEHTAPELVRQLSRLNENLERLSEAEAAKQKDKRNDNTDKDQKDPHPSNN